MIEVKLIGADGKPLVVDSDGGISATLHQHPHLNESVLTLPFRQFLTDDFSESGSHDMRVNGSVTHAEFGIKADPEHDTYIKTISIVIADAGATFNKFGNIPALTNGLDFEHSTKDSGVVTVDTGLKSNYDFVRLSQGNPSFGDGASAFKASNVEGASEAYIPVIDFSKIFGLPWGLRLRKNTADKILFRIKDDVSTVDRFDMIGFGIKI